MEEKEQSAEYFLELIKKSRKGKFKIYIGMSAGVGKTYRMLQESHTQTPREESDKINLAAQRHLINNFKLATELGAEVIKKKGIDVAKNITQTASEQECGLIIIGNLILVFGVFF